MKHIKKIIQGTQVDPKTVNVLVLGVVINILSQSEAMEEIEAGAKVLEQENLTNKTKIECLENWVLKQNDSIDDMIDKLARLEKNGVLVKESADVKALERKLVGIEIEISSLKNSNSRQKDSANPHAHNLRKCQVCDAKFDKNCDLERHVMEKHEETENFVCTVCDKPFVLEWRLEKHMKVHEEITKMCDYFKNNKLCPYEDIGCKFSHVQSKERLLKKILKRHGYPS